MLTSYDVIILYNIYIIRVNSLYSIFYYIILLLIAIKYIVIRLNITIVKENFVLKLLINSSRTLSDFLKNPRQLIFSINTSIFDSYARL